MASLVTGAINSIDERIQALVCQFERVRDLLAENRMEEAVAEMKAATRGTTWDETAIPLARLHYEIEQDALIVTDHRELSNRRTQLTVRILGAIRLWEKDIAQSGVPASRMAALKRLPPPVDPLVQQLEREVLSLEELPPLPASALLPDGGKGNE